MVSTAADTSDLDARLAQLFAQKRGLDSAGQRSLLHGAHRRSNISRRRTPEPLDDYEEPKNEAMITMGCSQSEAKESVPRGPGTPAWVRSEAERERLKATLDEAVEVSSSSDDESPARQASKDFERFTADERSTLERYGTIFDRLHGDLDLLVLRKPLVGQALAGLLRRLADTLLPSNSYAKELATLEPLQHCLDALSEMGDAWQNGSSPASLDANAAVADTHDALLTGPGGGGDGGDGPRQRQRFSKARPTINARQNSPASRQDGVPPPRSTVPLAANLNSFPSMIHASSPSGRSDNSARSDGGETKFLTSVEARCREQLRAKLTRLVDSEVELHFSRLKDRLAHLGSGRQSPTATGSAPRRSPSSVRSMERCLFASDRLPQESAA